MADTTHISETVSAGQLRAFIERIERVEEEIKTLNADKSEIYKELRGCGFDVKAVRQCVSARKLDSAEREERNAIFDLYWSALTGSVHVHTPAREIIEQFDAETGEITEHEQPETARNEPEAAAEVAGDYLREPVAAEQGQIIREGDAPRETDRFGGDASCSDTEYMSLGLGDGGNTSPNGAVLLSTPQGAGMERGIDRCVTAGETADDGRDVEASGGAASVITNSHPQPTSSPEADKTGEAVPPPSVSPVAISDDDVPAFLRKDAGPVDVTSPEFIKRLRPFCQNLEHCTGYGRECPKCKAARAA